MSGPRTHDARRRTRPDGQARRRRRAYRPRLRRLSPAEIARAIEQEICRRVGSAKAARARSFADQPRFADHLSRLPAGLQAKAITICAEVAGGMWEALGRRGAHQYRTGRGANAPQLVRTDGARAWRVGLEHKCSQARRLHWWALPGGRVEFVSITAHDERHLSGPAGALL